MLRRVRGVDLYEERLGSGPPVVALHGGPGAQHDYLRPGFDALAAGRTLIYYDQRGGGRSPVGRDTAVGWREQVGDLEALRDVWGLDRLTLVGYSWGALLALLYALEFPGRVDRLGLVSSAPVWKGARAEADRRLLARNTIPEVVEARRALHESGLRERDPEAYRRGMFALSVAGYFHDWHRARELTPFRITGRTQQEVWDSLGDYDLRPRLGEVRVPALILHGEDDPIPIETAETLGRGLGVTVQRLPACGHVPYVEAADRFAELLRGFLAAGP